MTLPERKKVARVIVRRGHKVLLVEKKTALGQFELPGGRCKPTESFKQTAVRELVEETNLKLETKNLSRWGSCTLITTHNPDELVDWVVYWLWLPDNKRVCLRPKHEIVSHRWFNLEKLPTDKKLERKTAVVLKYFRIFSP